MAPFRADESLDLVIVRQNLKHMLGKCIVPDGGHADARCIYEDGFDVDALRAIRARQETVFGRTKNRNILNHRYRHNLNTNSACFFAVAVMTQLSIDAGYKIFDITPYLP